MLEYDDASGAELLDFIKHGGNVVFGVDETINEGLRDVAAQFGVEFDDADTHAINHFRYNETHTTLITQQTSLFKADGGILFDGIGHASTANPMLVRVLSGEENTYSYRVGKRPVDRDPVMFEQEVGLASVFQTRSNARAAFVGSKKAFSDEFINSPIVTGEKNANKEFFDQLVMWTFQEIKVLVVEETLHKRKGGNTQETYCIKDHMEYQIKIKEFNQGNLLPFIPADMQLEAVMLDPYIRINLKPTASMDALDAEFQLPDVYGTFTLRVIYKRAGYSFVVSQDLVAVRPFRHNEYERFIATAYPYYASAASVMLAFITTSAAWMWHK